ncbi:MAG: metallophosphoesterase [Clostridia bacterium]|nr:metallophosphoesterase [Clostridia bacterium]
MDLRFKNGKFIIMQVSDAQDMQVVRKTMFHMLNVAYDTILPDLVVLTGDNILGNHLCDGRYRNNVYPSRDAQEKNMRKAINHLVAPIAKRGIPFAMVYGNHDDMNPLTKEEQADIYRSYPGCIGLDGNESGDVDTYNVPIYSEDGSRVAFNLWLMDTAWTDKETGEGHQGIKPEAFAWYKKTSKALAAENGGVPVPSLMFQHIPPYEQMQIAEQCEEGTPGAFRGRPLEPGDPDVKYFFRLKDDVEFLDGEFISRPLGFHEDIGQLEALKECGDVKAVVSGHIHTHCFDVIHNGMRYIQTPGASFRCFGNHRRGVRVFVIDEATGEFDTYTYSYTDLCGDGPVARFRYFWDVDECEAKKKSLLIKLGVAAGVIGATVATLAGVNTVKKRGKK